MKPVRLVLSIVYNTARTHLVNSEEFLKEQNNLPNKAHKTCLMITNFLCKVNVSNRYKNTKRRAEE